MIWIDLTDLLSWQGNFTGIQRTVFEYALSYREFAKYFYFDEINHSLVEIDGSALEQYGVLRSAPSAHNPNKLQKYKKITKKMIPNFILENMTVEQKQKVKEYLKTNGRKALSSSWLLSRKVKKSKSPDIVFSDGDIILILGAGWHKNGLMEKLIEHKFNNDKIKIVSLIYDLIPVYFPQLFGPGMYENYTKYIMKTVSISSMLIAISDSTKNDILKFCSTTGCDAPTVEVIRLGEEVVKTSSSQSGDIKNEGEYIISVGTIEVRKNHQIIYSAYKYAVLNNLKMPKLIIIGRKGWLTNDLIYQINNDPMVNNLIRIEENVTDNQLEEYYKNSLFTVYASIYEGWGLPIAESLSRGKLCIASNTSSMKEIAPNLVEHFSPYDAVGLAQKISSYYTSKEMLKKVEGSIRGKYRPTSWSESAGNLHTIISKIDSSSTTR